eukprot:TRINITY_DN20198_c0_g1_i1.p2 TRINITY_DN20198_c0_g1~~TRINITY_DN20198_c0_g1_i1.p2  ORF type:complete len:147 (-),score=12.91 TRINITY_DN20198_c0_g1_i1:317-757(-)
MITQKPAKQSISNLKNHMAIDSKNMLVLLDQSELDELNEKLNKMEELLYSLMNSRAENQFDWIESTKVPLLLGISRKTWQTYRDKRLIPFSQVNNKIHVKLSDLDEFLEKNKIPAIKYQVLWGSLLPLFVSLSFSSLSPLYDTLPP